MSETTKIAGPGFENRNIALDDQRSLNLNWDSVVETGNTTEALRRLFQLIKLEIEILPHDMYKGEVTVEIKRRHLDNLPYVFYDGNFNLLYIPDNLAQSFTNGRCYASSSGSFRLTIPNEGIHELRVGFIQIFGLRNDSTKRTYLLKLSKQLGTGNADLLASTDYCFIEFIFEIYADNGVVRMRDIQIHENTALRNTSEQ